MFHGELEAIEMYKKFSEMYNLSEEATKVYLKAAGWMSAYHIANMLPVVLLAKIVADMLGVFSTGEKPQLSFVPYLLIGIVFLIASFYCYGKAYQYKYLQSGKEDWKLRKQIAEKIRLLPMNYLGKKDLSDLINIIMDDVAIVQEALATATTELISGVIYGVVCISLSALVNWKMAFSLFICIPFAALSMILCHKVSNKTNEKNKQKKLVISDGIQEYLENIQVLHCSPQEKNYINHLFSKMNKTIGGLVLYEFLSGFVISLASNILHLGLGICIVVGTGLLISGELSVPVFLLFLFISVRVYEPLSKACEKLGVLVHATVSANRIGGLLNTPVQLGKTDITFENYDIDFSDVSFSYNQEDMVLNNISFTARQGEITALVGPSGCGKSTICRLAARFYDVENGQITIGNQNINKIDPEELMKNFSFVFQDVVLFNDTIYNNIKIGNEKATREEIIHAAKLARCEDFIDKMPQGYDTIIGENGRTLSGGQRQRLSIARAFLKDAPIILLDESTASIDSENETKIQEAIGQLVQNKTVIIIAHRLRSICDCDKIVVLKRGNIVEEGRHKQLMKQRGVYYKLYQLQTNNKKFTITN